MSKNDKTNLNLLILTIMPDLYSIQKMWNKWEDAIKKIKENPNASDINYVSLQEETPPSCDQKYDVLPTEK